MNFEVQLSEYLYGQTDSMIYMEPPQNAKQLDSIWYCKNCSYISSKEKCPNCGSEDTE